MLIQCINSICIDCIFTLFFIISDHSFFSSEWQKRWCVISNSVFYYYGSEKGLYLNTQKHTQKHHRLCLARKHTSVFSPPCTQISSRRVPSISPSTVYRWWPTRDETQRKMPVLSLPRQDDGLSRSELRLAATALQIVNSK